MNEHGQVGGIEALVFGVLLFVLGTLVVANAWGVIDAKVAAATAAREAARAYVEAAPDSAHPEAEAAARDAIAGHGRSPDRMELDLPESLDRCQRITVEVRYHVPLISIPLIGRTGSGFTAAARHSEIVDPYRSGLPGEARCEA